MVIRVRSLVLAAVVVTALVQLPGTTSVSPGGGGGGRGGDNSTEAGGAAVAGKGSGTHSARLIEPIRNRLAQLEGVLVKSERELRDAVMAHTLAGNIGEALAAMRELLRRFPALVKGDDRYKAALLAKSSGRQGEAIGHLTEYLDSAGWRSVSSTSFLGTLYFEQGLYAEAEGAFRMSIRLGARNPPVHTMSMLVATALRLGHVRHAHSVYAALLGHSATSTDASGADFARKIPLEFGALRIVPQGGEGASGGSDGYVSSREMLRLTSARSDGGGGGKSRMIEKRWQGKFVPSNFPTPAAAGLCCGITWVIARVDGGWGQ